MRKKAVNNRLEAPSALKGQRTLGLAGAHLTVSLGDWNLAAGRGCWGFTKGSSPDPSTCGGGGGGQHPLEGFPFRFVKVLSSALERSVRIYCSLQLNLGAYPVQLSLVSSGSEELWF